MNPARIEKHSFVSYDEVKVPQQEAEMSTRNEYVDKLKENLDKWNADIGEWEAKARVARTDLQIDYEMKLDALRKQRDEGMEKLKELQATGEDAWKDLVAGADAAWDAMRDAFDKATSHFKKDD